MKNNADNLFYTLVILSTGRNGRPPLTITPSETLAKCLLLVIMTVSFADLEVSVPNEGLSSKRGNNNFTELEIKTITWPLWPPHASDSTGEKKELL